MEKLTEEETALWGDLVSKAHFALDEGGEEKYAKLAERVSRRRAEMAERGMRPLFYDPARAKRVLLDYAKTFRYAESVKRHCVWADEVQTAMDAEPELKLVFDYLGMRRRQMREFENGEMLDDAREAATAILREGDSGKRTKMATFAMERLDRKSFGADDRASEEASTANRTVYRVENVNIGQITLGKTLSGREVNLDVSGIRERIAARKAELLEAETVESESRPVAALPIGDE